MHVFLTAPAPVLQLPLCLTPSSRTDHHEGQLDLESCSLLIMRRGALLPALGRMSKAGLRLPSGPVCIPTVKLFRLHLSIG